METGFTLFYSEQVDTISAIAARRGVAISDLWFPFGLLRPGRASSRVNDDTPISIPPYTAAVLLERKTSQLTTRRRDILSQLPVIVINADSSNNNSDISNAHHGALSDGFAIPPSAIPDGFILFVRASQQMGRRRIPLGTALLHRPITSAEAVAEGSALIENALQQRKKPCNSEHSAIAAVKESSSVACSKRERGDAVFEEYLKEALDKRGIRSGVIVAETRANILRVRSAPPLHFIVKDAATSIRVRDVVWNVPDRRVLYRVFRRVSGTDGGKSSYTDASRLLAVMLIDSVLLHRNCLVADKSSWSLVDANIPRAAAALAERGYRIVLLDHYPALHHGNTVALETRLQPIAELCKEHFLCDVTVVVSTTSYISAYHRREGMPFVMPYSGVWQFFIAHLNGGLRADDSSLLVGTASKDGDNEVCGLYRYQLDSQFAANCGLRYVDGDSLKKDLMIALS